MHATVRSGCTVLEVQADITHSNVDRLGDVEDVGIDSLESSEILPPPEHPKPHGLPLWVPPG